MSDFYTENNVVLCRAFAEDKRITHGFSTRAGGVSALEWTKSMNLAFGRGDEDETVIKNREIFAKNVGFDKDMLVCGEQTHSTNVRYADGKTKLYPDTDGFVTDKTGVFLGVKTADCQPILFYDADNGIVGACHAGWRGTMNKIAAVTVFEMEKLGANRKKIKAALGPCICEKCFEVKEDFIKTFEENAPDLMRFITGFHADVRRMNEYVLLETGLIKDNIFVSDECTCCQPEKYYSHRYSKGKRGTMMAVIGICRAMPDS